MNLKNRDFISTQDWKKEELVDVLELAEKLKKKPVNEVLKNKKLAMVFFDPSLRTRMSFQIAMNESGGFAYPMDVGNGMWKLEHREGAVMNEGYTEHVKEAVKVLGRYVDAIGVRSFSKLQSWEEDKHDPVIASFVKNSPVPVINMESALHHPCQALADIMTIREQLGKNLKGKKFVLSWAYHPKALPMAVPNSAALIAGMFGMDVTVAHPKGFELDDGIMSMVKKNCETNGGELKVVNDQAQAMKGAHIVYAKSWGSKNYYGKWDEEKEVREKCVDWKITLKNMGLTDNAKFMHCLPVRRNVVVDDAVLDGKDCIVYDEAENRLHAQKALLHKILGE